MKLNLIERIIGSGFFTGYAPVASGTVASIAAFLFFLIPGFENPSLLILVISASIIIGKNIADKFETIYGKDPVQFTLDEFIGMWISLLFIPKKIWFLIPAFVIWRAIDIFKPFPVRKLESLKGGWGVIIDDVGAGIYTFMIMQIIIHLINRLT
ncbi:MAG: phosphatidylglycerophosphatase A [Bacteroidota bacterium]